jgi:hypothetical protein
MIGKQINLEQISGITVWNKAIYIFDYSMYAMKSITKTQIDLPRSRKPMNLMVK